jgi:hypothetical protein
MNQDEKPVSVLVHHAKMRVSPRTQIQDITEPLSGNLDQRRVAAKFTRLEEAVDDLADAVAHIADDEQRSA